ncbi:MAG: LysE family translocator, partial [Candidatus Aquicultorales bacterium]
MSAYITIAIAAFITALSGAMMPGPLLTVTVDQTARRGWTAALILMVGHAVLELAMVVALVYGLGHLLSAPLVNRAIGLVGGVFLLWMGWGIIRSVVKRTVSLDIQAQGMAAPRGNLVLSGIA